MSGPDLVLLHAPSVMDFRDRTMLLGPVSDLIPSTPVFEMYPVGFLTIASHLESKGYKVRIANLATRMLASKTFDPERFIRSLDPGMFGIDLHWLPHVQGSLELSKMVKRHHPDTPLVMGGFSASYYHEEIMRDYPQVDYILRGDSTEVPMHALLDAALSGRPLDGVPNLSWRAGRGINVNPLTNIPGNLDGIAIDYGLLVRKVLRYRDVSGHLPYSNWKANPMSIALSVRGCLHNCTNCQGSCDSFARNFGRTRPAFRSPDLLAEDISRAEDYIKGATFVVGDIRQAGRDYSSRFLKELKARGVKNEVVLELFTGADREFADAVAGAAENFSVQMSPETHDENVRAAQGKPYTNAALEKSAEAFLEAGCGRFDMFYMIGLPHQTADSVADTVRYAEKLYSRFKGGKLFPFISPLAPFLDPGGNAFEQPEKHGFRLRARTLAEHLALATMPSWKHVLNYETDWMTRDQIVDSTYAAGLGLNEVKRKMGLIDHEVAQRTRDRMEAAWGLSRKIDALVAKGLVASDLQALGESARGLSESTVCEKQELDWSESSIYASFPRILRSLITGR